MKRRVLYSGSVRRPSGPDTPPPAPSAAAQTTPGGDSPAEPRTRRPLARNGVRLVLGLACAMLLFGAYRALDRRTPSLTQEDIDAAVLHTLENKMLPARAAKAADTVRPALVRVRGYGDSTAVKAGKGKPRAAPGADAGADRRGNKAGAEDDPMSVGSGVVIIDDGTILTNLHVVYGAKRVSITFYDGTEADADLVSVHPENDLAVIKAQKIPDDLTAATLASASRLKPGEEVVAVGFPFGMGPSVTHGVVSGLNREFRSPEGKRVLTRLIQFDAAANPGSSGGPLVTMQGDVVGIVTAILNPTQSGTFIGIGFAVTIGAAGRAVGMHPF